jgi:OFA family oxalate/formate antiporter-like MFS transporter
MQQRYVVLLACLVIQTCLGGIYAWSVVVPALRDKHGLTSTQTQIIFGTTIAVFALVTIPAGRALPRVGPRFLGVLSGLLFLSGGILVGRSHGEFWLLWLAFSGVIGAAIGCGYVCPLVLCMQWFPRHKGLATGLAVGCFGAGAIVEAALIEWLIQRGWGPIDVLEAVGLGYGMTLLAAGLALASPLTQHGSSAAPSVAVRKLLLDPSFRVALIGIFCGTFAGLLVIGDLKAMALAAGMEATTCLLGVSVFALGNAAGRIAWGWILDRAGRHIIPLSLVSLAVATLLLCLASYTGPLFVLLCGLVGFGFGACFVVYAGYVASEYGIHRFGSVYPLVFLGYGFSGVAGPLAGGWLVDLSGSHLAGTMVAATVALLGAGQTWMLLTARPSTLGGIGVATSNDSGRVRVEAPGGIGDLLRRPFERIPPAVQRRVFGVDYARLDLAHLGELYVTSFGWPLVESLLPDRWHTDNQYVRQGQRLRGGTGTVYKVDVPHPRLGCISLVLKFSRFAQDVPLSVSSEVLYEMPADPFQSAHFAGPFEEFGCVMALRRAGSNGPGPRVLTKRPLAIYVPPTHYALWQTGRTEGMFERRNRVQVADQQRYPTDRQVHLDIHRHYSLLYAWVEGADAVIMHDQGLLDREAMYGLTRRSIREMHTRCFRMLDIKPRHLILRRRPDGSLLSRNGQLVYALIDFELLEPCEPCPDFTAHASPHPSRPRV